MQVKMVALRSLQVTLLERLAVPDAVTLVHGHMVHVDGNPYIAGGIGYPVID